MKEPDISIELDGQVRPYETEVIPLAFSIMDKCLGSGTKCCGTLDGVLIVGQFRGQDYEITVKAANDRRNVK